MAIRQIKGLVSAAALDSRPSWIPKSRPRGKKAEGLRYERKLAKALPGARHGEWYEFEDDNGPGCCQPDLVMELRELVVVLECKYSWTAEAYVQLECLYGPVLSRALGKRVIGLQVCKVLREGAQQTRVCGGLGNALLLANMGRRVTWHWLPDTPVLLTMDQRSELDAKRAA